MGGGSFGWRKNMGFKKLRLREKMNKEYSNPILAVSFIAFLLLDHTERLIKMLYC